MATEIPAVGLGAYAFAVEVKPVRSREFGQKRTDARFERIADDLAEAMAGRLAHR